MFIFPTATNSWCMSARFPPKGSVKSNSHIWLMNQFTTSLNVKLLNLGYLFSMAYNVPRIGKERCFEFPRRWCCCCSVFFYGFLQYIRGYWKQLGHSQLLEWRGRDVTWGTLCSVRSSFLQQVQRIDFTLLFFWSVR